MKTIECPYCGEEIKEDARKCRYCREWIDTDATKDKGFPYQKNSSHQYVSFEEINEDTSPKSGYFPVSNVPNDSNKQQEAAVNKEKPSLELQNLKSGEKNSMMVVVTGMCLVLLAFFFIGLFDRPDSIVETVTFGILKLCFLVQVFYFLSLFRDIKIYLRNLGVFRGMSKYVLLFQLSLVSLIGCLAYELSVKVPISIIIIYLASIISLIFMGLYILSVAKRDFVGGTKPLGISMFLVILYPFAWIFIIFPAHAMFSKAIKYAKLHGLDPDGVIPESNVGKGAEIGHGYRFKSWNLKLGMLYSCLLTLFLGFNIALLIEYAASEKDSSLIETVNIYWRIGFFFLQLVLFILLLNEVRKYLRNFDNPRNIGKNILCVQLSSLFFFIVIVATDYIPEDIFPVIFFMFFSFIYISFPLAGKSIINIRIQDSIGGSEWMGRLMFFGAIFPPVWFLIPSQTGIMFSKAIKHTKRYSFDEEKVSENETILIDRE